MRFVKRRDTKKALTVSPFLNVTWAEIEKAKRLREEQMEFELDNIDETVKPDRLDLRVADNVEFLLKEEGLLPPGTHVSIPAPGVDYACEPMEDVEGVQECSFSGGFDIYDASGWNELGSGYVAGKMYYDEDNDEFIIRDLSVFLPTEEVEKLFKEAEKARK